jgi:hypothetical protein
MTARTPKLRAAVVRQALGLSRKISQPGLVTMVIVLGTVWIMSQHDRIEWTLVAFSLIGLSIFLSFELIARRFSRKIAPPNR